MRANAAAFAVSCLHGHAAWREPIHPSCQSNSDTPTRARSSSPGTPKPPSIFAPVPLQLTMTGVHASDALPILWPFSADDMPFFYVGRHGIAQNLATPRSAEHPNKQLFADYLVPDGHATTSIRTRMLKGRGSTGVWR